MVAFELYLFNQAQQYLLYLARCDVHLEFKQGVNHFHLYELVHFFIVQVLNHLLYGSCGGACHQALKDSVNVDKVDLLLHLLLELSEIDVLSFSDKDSPQVVIVGVKFDPKIWSSTDQKVIVLALAVSIL